MRVGWMGCGGLGGRLWLGGGEEGWRGLGGCASFNTGENRLQWRIDGRFEDEGKAEVEVLNGGLALSVPNQAHKVLQVVEEVARRLDAHGDQDGRQDDGKQVPGHLEQHRR